MGKIINISDKLNKSTDKQAVNAVECEAQVIDNEVGQQNNTDKGKIIPFPKRTLNVADCFAGIGAGCLALKRIEAILGITFKCVGYSEINKDAIKAYRKLHGEEVPYLGDVTKIAWEELDFDILFYTFPCQGVSQANFQGQKGIAEGTDSKSSILWTLRDILTRVKHKPKLIFFENVKALLNKKNKKDLDKFLTFMKCQGYHVDMAVLDALDFGVPQHRERVFILATYGFNPEFTFPEPIPLKVKLKDILEEDVSPKFNLTDRARKGFVERGMRNVKPFPIRVCNPDYAEKAFTLTTSNGTRNFDNFVFRKNVSKDSVVQISQKGLKKADLALADIEKVPIRKLTPEENMILMGLNEEERAKLRDEFTPNTICRLMGNAIVVPVLEHLFYEYFNNLEQKQMFDVWSKVS